MIHRSARWCCAACYCSFRLRYIVHRLYSTIVTMRSNWGGSNNPFPFHLPAVAHSGSMAHRLCYSLTGEKTITGSTTWLPTSVYLCFLIFTGVFDWSLVYTKASFFSFFSKWLYCGIFRSRQLCSMALNSGLFHLLSRLD